MNYQISLFDIINNRKQFKIDKPIRLIELFAGYGSQHFALDYLGANFESWKICEWAIKSIQAYKDAHFSTDNTDYSKELTRDQVEEYLFNKGISSNYNDPMTLEQIKRLGEEKARVIYNNIIATHNLVSVVNCKAEDLEIVDRDQYIYMLTYSYPCQDLSKSGKRRGMAKGSGTRSGLLWEVERILEECHGNLPHVLIMENVPDVIGEKNKLDFAKWYQKLESLGYANFYKILNAKDYGIPQHRERCFMVSVLGDYYYIFPEKRKLRKRLKDFLEPHVDEKYYLSEKMIQYISFTGTKNFKNPDCRINLDIARPLTTDQGKRAGTTNYISEELPDNFDLQNECLKIKEKTKKGYTEAQDGDGVYINRPHQKRGVVQKGMIQTIKTSPDIGVVVKDEINVIGNYSPSGHDDSRIVHPDGIAPTVKENHGTVTATIVNAEIKPKLVGGIGDKKSNGGTQYYQQDRIYDSESIATAHPANLPGGSYKYQVNISPLRIRKLSPLECWRLMGVKDQDFDKVAKNQSDSSLYHLAGDSIVVDVLKEIISMMLD